MVVSHDVLVEHLRVRPGDLPDGPSKQNRDAAQIIGNSQGSNAVFNVVVDHCSLSRGTDENFSTWYRNVYDLTLINSIVSEGLMNAGHPKGTHSKGFLVGDHTQNAAIVNTLCAHNNQRNLLIMGDVSMYMANNIVYGYGNQPIALADLEGAGPSKGTVIGNDIIPGPASSSSYGLRVYKTAGEGTQVYVRDNNFPGCTSDP